jgi:glycolate oxidase iron-sulfur subunit
MGSPLDPTGELRHLASDCVHCGFCLPACPTYQLWGEEMDSPRGRIHLITQLLDGSVGTEAAALHLDRCLGCMACVPACPSGVRYDRLITAARSWQEELPPAADAGPSAEANSLATVAGTDDATAPAAGNAPPGNAADAAGPSAEVSPPVAGSDPPGNADVPAGTAAGVAPPAGSADPDTARARAARAAARLASRRKRRTGASGPREAATAGAGPGGPQVSAAAPSGPAVLPPRSVRDRATRAAIFATFPYPRRLRPLLAPLRAAQKTGVAGRLARSTLTERLTPELAAALRVAPGRSGGPLPGEPSRLPPRVSARGPRRAVVGMLTGCVQQVFFPAVNAATARVLAAEGCDVIIPASQGCCGALSMHGGRLEEARRFAKRTIAAFEQAGVDAIVVNAAGCGSAMKEYAELLEGHGGWGPRADALTRRVRDFSEFLTDLGPAARRHPLPVEAAYHDACHLGHAQRITAQPRALLDGIPGLTLTEIPNGSTCCGSAGIYNLVQPGTARQLGELKAEAVTSTGARLLISANPGCALQISAALAARGTALPMAHIAEVLDASLRGAPVGRLLGS